MKKTAIEYKEIVQQWTDENILILGDAMLDEYIFGNVHRISPEAPVPVIHVQEKSVHLGGACNVARNIKTLGGNPIFISCSGDDAYASIVKTLLDDEGIENYLFPIPQSSTTVKTRVLAERQHVVRIDREDIVPMPLEVASQIAHKIEDILERVDVVIYSDYAKGFFSTHMVGVLENIWKKHKRPKILVDPKVVNIGLFKNVFLVTPNSKETEESTGISIAETEGLYKAAGILFNKCQCENVLTTLGSRGMALFTSPQDMTYISVIAQEVFDVTGAGDAVIATIAVGLANKIELEDAVWLANCAGAYSVRYIGVVSVTKEALLEMIPSALNTPQGGV